MLLDRWMDLVANRASLAEAIQELIELREQDTATSALTRRDAEVLSALDDRELHELIDIREAVARIESGTFGRCAKCGDEINGRRLQAMPWASTCLACTTTEPPIRARREPAPNDPHHLARRALLDVTEAADSNDERVARCPSELVYQPDELLHDHLRSALDGEDHDE